MSKIFLIVISKFEYLSYLAKLSKQTFTFYYLCHIIRLTKLY
jgi:hypothetical protein